MTDQPADPVFKDAASCKKWLAQLQLTNLRVAHSLLLTEILELNRFAMPEQERLETLELLRETVAYVQGEYAKRLIGKPLPLNESDLIVFISIMQLWQAMSSGYERSMEAYTADDRQLAKHGALLCQRSMLYDGLTILEYLRTGYEPDEQLWRRLHGLYAFAEKQEWLSVKVVDPLNKTHPQMTCHGAYLGILLTSYANPAEFNRTQLHLLDLWLPQWIGLLTVARNYTSGGRGDALPLAFDLNDPHHGLQPARAVKPGDSVRYVAMVPLSKLIRVKTILLQQGKTPAEVELGDSGDSRECIALLTLLHQRWCEDLDQRFAARTETDHHAAVCHPAAKIYAQLTGKSYKPPAKATQDDSAARKQIETFGRVLQEAPDRKAADTLLEAWHIDNENLRGVQLTREAVHGGQLARNQLLALRRGNMETFALGVAEWVRVVRTGQLRIGVRYLPGQIEAVDLQAIGADHPASGRISPAFLLHPVVTLKIPASLIVLPGWFSTGRTVEVVRRGGEKQNVKMNFSVERGFDYERISFTPT